MMYRFLHISPNFIRLFLFKYQIITRGVDGMSGEILYALGKKELNSLLKEIEASKYTNVVSIYRVTKVKDNTKKKQNWFK